MMEPAMQPLTDFVSKLNRRPPQVPWVSNVTGKLITAEEAVSPAYWAKHLRRTVRFADGVAELMKAGTRVLLEVGPGQTLAGLAKQHRAATAGAAQVITSLVQLKDTSTGAAVDSASL